MNEVKLLNTIKKKRETIKCEKCGKELIFDDQMVEEINGKVYCKVCAKLIDNY